MPINQLNNGDSGLTARTIINDLVTIVNTSTVTSSISASLATTASYAITASYALNGGGGGSINTSSLVTTGSNIFIGNQIITGSVNITGSLLVNLDSSGGPADGLYAINSTTFTLNSLNPAGGSPSQGGSSINWYNRTLLDGYGAVKLDWVNSYLKDGTDTTLDWINRSLYSSGFPSSVLSLDWNSRYLYDSSGGTISLDWNSRYLNDGGAFVSVDWGTRQLSDGGFPFPILSLDWNSRTLNDSTGIPILNYYGGGSPITFTGTSSYAIYAETASFAQTMTLQAYDPLPSSSIGTIAVSASTPPKPYFYDGSTWNALY